MRYEKINREQISKPVIKQTVSKNADSSGWYSCNNKLPTNTFFDEEMGVYRSKDLLVTLKGEKIIYRVGYYSNKMWFCAVTDTPIKVSNWREII